MDETSYKGLVELHASAFEIYGSSSILSDRLYRVAHEVFVKQEIYNVYSLTAAVPRI